MPIAKPEFSTNDTTPVLPAKVVIALSTFVKVKVAPAPKSSNPSAVIPAACVTVPNECKVRLFVVSLAPNTDNAPAISMPPFDIAPPLINFNVSLKV